MVDAVSKASSPVSGALGGGAEKGMGKTEFLKLLVAQIQNQDPLKPQTDTAFVAQLAQFSSLEQQLSSNKFLELVATQQQGLANSADMSLIGKTVTVKGGTINYDGEGLGTAAVFKLGGAAQKVTVTVRDANGNVVRSMELGAQAAGKVNAIWDGKNESGTVQPAGRYTISVDAKSAEGSPVNVEQESSGKVTALTFASGRATMVLDSGESVPTSEILRVAQ